MADVTKWINAKYSGVCYECGKKIEIGEHVLYLIDFKKVKCEKCGNKKQEEEDDLLWPDSIFGEDKDDD